jgi:hypothetical protein
MKSKLKKLNPKMKKTEADKVCSKYKKTYLKDKCYKERGIFTKKVRENNEKSLKIAKKKCSDIKSPGGRRTC